MPNGGCFCGRIRYEAGSAPYHQTICHCADCRRAVGAVSVAWFTVARSAFRFASGEPTLFRSSARAVRSFCPACGTALTFASDDLPDEIDVTIASLDDPDAESPKDHVHAASKVAWEVIADGLPFRPGPPDAAAT